MDLGYLKLVVGRWQLAEGHSDTGPKDALRTLEVYYEAGFGVLDCADIYGRRGAPRTFIKPHGLTPGDIKVHTKHVPDLASLATLAPEQVEATIARTRLGL